MQHCIKILLPKSFLFLISILIINKNGIKERIKSKIHSNSSNYSVDKIIINFKPYILVTLLFFILFTTMMISDIDTAFAKKDSKRKTIDICCSWGNSISDGVLTFSIKNGGSDLAKIVKVAIKDWEKALGDSVQFKNVKEDDSDADIEIEFKKGKGEKVGKAVTFFDHNGKIDHVEISISKKSYGRTLDQPLLEHVAKHEFGHALGLGHANFKESLMSVHVNKVVTKISACELESVKYVNNWKFTDDDKSSSTLDKDSFRCKNK